MSELEHLAEELARARAALEEARADHAALASWKALLETSPVTMIVVDREMRILKCSPFVTRRLGVTEAESLGQSLYDFLPATRAFADVHQRCLTGEAIHLEDFPLESPFGLVQLRVDLTPWHDADGAVGGLVAVSYDTSDVARARDAVRRSSHRLTLALEMSESLVWEMSFKDRRLFATGAVAAIYDEPPTFKAFSEDLFVAVHPEDRARVQLAWDMHLKDGRPFRTEYRVNRRDGEEVWVDAVAETLRDDAGELDRVIGVLRNSTKRKHDQLAVAHAREAAEAANRAKSEFLANMSHEIRTPLNGVLGVAGALGRTSLAPEQRQMVDLIEGSAETLERLLTDILDLARIEAGRFEVKREHFHLGGALRTVAALFAPRAEDKGVDFELEIDPACEAEVLGDTVRLRQILTNLLSNAVKFTDTGRVRLTARPGAEPGQVRFEVTDTGIGFDPAEARRLFERFQQADGSITRRYGGSGLGLAISRSLAEHLGGSLEAESEPGRGSVFVLTLELAPFADEAKAPSPADVAAEPAESDRPPARVLLAEDHPINRKVVELILASAPVELVSVVNGAEAVEAASTQRFDLILMDMQMPVMDGLTAIRAIRALERERGEARTPILALTANAMAEHVRASAEAGADGHVTKPVSAQALLDAVAEACTPGARDAGRRAG